MSTSTAAAMRIFRRRGRRGTANAFLGVVGGATLSNGLILAWNMDESGATENFRDSGKNRLTGVTSGSLPSAAGMVGTARENAGTGHATVGDSFNFDIQYFTLCAWLYQGETPGATKSILGRWGTSGQQEWRLKVATDQTLTFEKTANGVDVSGTVSAAGLMANAWRWVCLVRGESEMRLRIGAPDGSTVANVTAANSTALYNGSPGFRVFGVEGDANQFIGRMDCVQLWNRALTTEEQDEVFNTGFGDQAPF